MTTSPSWKFAVEVHPVGWCFPRGSSWVAGWIWAAENRFVSDLRAWLDHRPFLGLYGLPKPDLDRQLLGRSGPPYSGFAFLIEPHAGASILRLEARDPTGNWTEFFRTKVSTQAEVAPCPRQPILADNLSGLLLALLRLGHQRPQIPSAALANELVAASLSVPLNSLPNPPFHGSLEEPRSVGWLRYGRLSVTGWLAHRQAKIIRITALVDAVQECVLLHGLDRSDVGALFNDLPDHEKSQFVGHVDLPANQSSPVLLKVFAELDNGEKHLAFAQRFEPRIIAGADNPLPTLSRRSFGAASLALLASARRHNLPWGDPGSLLVAFKSAWQNFRAEAPRRNHGPSIRRPALETADGRTDPRPLRVLLATHNLNFEGAPWFIYELALHLKNECQSFISVISPQDGPMRRVFADAGMEVTVLDLAPAFAAHSPAEFDEQLLTAMQQIDPTTHDLVLANTMVSFWAVHYARHHRRPAVMYVHESAAIHRFFEPVLAPGLLPIVEGAFRYADRVVFTAIATEQVHEHLQQGNFVLLKSWVDLARVDAFKARTDRRLLRLKHGLDPDAVLLVNIGSVCERKGQHIFIRAIQLLSEELRFTYPDRVIQFVMVGARHGLYLESLRQELALHELSEAVFIPETGDIYDFYHLADVFVCTSFEESFPRVLLESAAFGLPIISTNVNGIPEMLSPEEAWLTPPGDRYQLAEAIKSALVAHFAGDRTKALRARARVERDYHLDRSLPLHANLMAEVAL